MGLIDEIAVDKADAIAKCEAFILGFAKVNSNARAMAKLGLRAKALNNLKNNREADLQAFLSVVTLPKVQQVLDVYMQSLKKK